jgi:hypothetical protein
MRGRGDDRGQGTHRPPPASQATAHEVVCGWNDNGEMMRGRRQGNDTRPMKHPQPLPRAIAHGVERGATSVYGHEGGMGDRGNERRQLQQHAALCIKGKVVEIQPFRVFTEY